MKKRLLNRCRLIIAATEKLIEQLEYEKLAEDMRLNEDLKQRLIKYFTKNILLKTKALQGKLMLLPGEEVATDLGNQMRSILTYIERFNKRRLEAGTCKNNNNHYELLRHPVRIFLTNALNELAGLAMLNPPRPEEIEMDTIVNAQAIILQQQQKEAVQDSTFQLALKNVCTWARSLDAEVSVFISYAWFSEHRPWEQWVQPFLQTLKSQLELAGLMVYMDIYDSRYGFNSNHHMDRIESCHYVIVIGTESLLDKFQGGVSAVCNELNQIRKRREQDAKDVIPIVVNGTMRTALPTEYERFTVVESFLGGSYVQTIKEILAKFYYVSPVHPDFVKAWQPCVSLIPQQTLPSITNIKQSHTAISDEIAYFPTVTIQQRTSRTNYLNKLKTVYQDKAFSGVKCLFNDETMAIEDYYVNLALIKEAEQKPKEEDQLNRPQNNELIENEVLNENASAIDNDLAREETSELFNRAERLFEVQESIELKDIFKPLENNATNRLLIIGSAGIGKTTLCQYIANQWAQGKLWADRYQGLFRIPLRNLIASRYMTKRNYGLLEIINQECFDNRLTQQEQCDLDVELKNYPERYLIILDGYDELSNHADDKYLVAQTLTLIKHPEIIVTSRPQPIEFVADKKLEILGFTEENIERYIANFFQNQPDKSEKLRYQLQQQPLLKSLAHIPINLELICSAWQSRGWSEEQSLTDLYQHLVDWLQYRYLKKYHPYYSREVNLKVLANLTLIKKETLCSEWLIALESIAWQMRQKGSIYVSKDQLFADEKEIKTRDKLLEQLDKSGLLKLTSDKQFYYFAHLTFQEFFAARYAARIIQKARNQGNADYEAFQTFFKANKFNPKLQVVWWFIAGLLKNDSKALDRYFHLMLQEPHDILVFSELPLFIHCLEQSNLAEKSYVGKKILDKLSLHISTLIENKLPELGLRNKNLLRHIKLNTNFLGKKILFPWIKKFEKSDISAKRLAVKVLKLLDEEVAILAQVDKHTAEKIMMNFGLIELLQDADIGVRNTAINILNTLGDKVDAEPVVKKLLYLLECPEWERKETAAHALSELGRGVVTQKTMLGLVGCLKQVFNDTAHTHKRYIFINAFNQSCKQLSFSEASDCLLSLLDDPNWQIQQIAVKILAHFGEKAANQQVLDQLSNLLNHPEPELQLAVANILGELGENAATNQVKAELSKLLKSKRYSIKAASAKTLIKLKIESTYLEVYNCLLNLLKEERLDARGLAAGILNQIKANLPMDNLINHLSNLLKNPEIQVQKAVIKAVGILGESAVKDQVIQELLNILNSNNEHSFKELAIETLAKLGKQAATLSVFETISKYVYETTGDKLYSLNKIKIALSSICVKLTFSELYRALSKLLSSPSWKVQQMAVEILSQFNEKAATEEVLNCLSRLLKESNISLTISIYSALSKFGEKASKVEIINYLLEDTKNSSLELREAAIVALAELAKKADAIKVIRGLSDYLHGVSDESSDKMSAAKSTLKKTLIKLVDNSSTSKALKLLFEMLKDSDAKISDVLTDVLIEFEAQLPAVTSIEKLFSMLEDVKWWRRKSAIIILGHLGEKAAVRKVIDKLFSLLKDKDYIQRKLIAEALGQLGSTIKEANLTKEVINWLQVLRNDNRVNVYTTARTALEYISKKIDKDELLKIIKDAPKSLASFLIEYLFSRFVGAPLIIENNCLTWYEFNRGKISIRLEKAVLEKLKKVSNECVVRNFKNINFLFQQAPYVESAVLQALSEGNLQLIETTLAHDASLLNLLTENNESLTIHVFQLTISEAFEIQKLVLSYRPFVCLEQLNQVLENDFLFHYQDNRESKAQNLLLTEKIISTLIGISNFNEKAHSERLQVLAYALDMNLDSQSHQARGLFAEDYLLFRLAYYLQLLGKLVNGKITPDQYPHGLDKKPLSKHALIALVKREMLLVWEALRLHEEWQCITYPSQDYSKEQIAKLWDCHALSLINKLKVLSEGEELIYPTGYEGHCIYVVFMRLANKIIGRVDNLLEADIKGRHQEDAKGYKPYLLGEWLINEQLGGSHCSLKRYLTEGLFLAKSRGRGQALKLIYQQTPKENNQTLISWPSLPVQSRDNCVVKGFQLGLLCRSVSEDVFKFLEEEHAKLWVSAIINPIPVNNNTSLPVLVAPNNNNQRAMGLASNNTQNKQEIILRTIEKSEKPLINFDTPLFVQKIIPISKVNNLQQTNSVLPTTYPSPISQPANTNSVNNNNNNPLHVDTSDSDLEPDNQSKYLVM